ncbi:hypothetical protein [uncultured Desulfobacter sp.]|uniref:hypothetical protein n=1 Tax=uncultured Desulfobacter sp. TaxID=240139 RepID=UPI0029F5642E|nr:hypothetical protein [uncultured Desulfobacter sp.]
MCFIRQMILPAKGQAAECVRSFIKPVFCYFGFLGIIGTLMCLVPVRASETKPDPLINVNARQLEHWIVATNADVSDKRYSLEASIHRF